MQTTKRRFWSNKRFRIMLTLELAVMLPAAALIYVNFAHLKSLKHGKKVEATIHRDFLYTLSMSEKKMNDRIFEMTDEIRALFPSPAAGTDSERGRALDQILSGHPWAAHAFIYDSEKGLLLRSQCQPMADPYIRREHDHLNTLYSGWFGMEGKMVCDGIRSRPRRISCHGEMVKRPSGSGFLATAFFTLPGLPSDQVVFGGISFDPDYLKQTFFPEMFEQIISQKITEEDRGDPLALTVFPRPDGSDPDPDKSLVSSTGWGEGKPEVTRNLEDAFSGLTLGIKFQGTSADAIASRWIKQGFIILGVLSLLMIGGLVLTYRSVSKEMSLARMKSDFVSNVSHELRTPLSLIQLYAETLELGRISTQEKKEEYYRTIRKESERLGKLISNILDFSRIEAGRKEYDLRETDIAELVRNTLDTYRYQIEKNGFEFETSIEPNIPRMRLDREAIARALLNLVNNALKYSDDEKFLKVNLYRTNATVKLEVVDRGIGIARRDQTKIFEKFYRTGDPLVHNTKGSGLGLSLVKHITHAHGGQVEVESTPGKGSKFTLSLPLTTGVTGTEDRMAAGATA
ncbi:MAG TPA: HAMP domain-containing sensor histidine kinase [Blastocatellia bacterium]|nr:HAMP domain-containing sensor histidine kinase [Blastocatellia bacterium]